MELPLQALGHFKKTGTVKLCPRVLDDGAHTVSQNWHGKHPVCKCLISQRNNLLVLTSVYID